MLDDYRRRLEIGSHKERLHAVRALGEMQTRDAYQLLGFAADDVDFEIQQLALKMMRESCWDSGSSSRSASVAKDLTESQESFF